MGVAVSGWPLARAVSLAGQLGVVSGTALAVVLARRLQLGDPGGELRRALAQFPLPANGRPRPRGLLYPRRQVPRHALQAHAHAHASAPARAGGTDRRRQLRRSLPGQGRPRRPGRHQLPREDSAPHAARRSTARCWRAWTTCSWARAFRAPFPARSTSWPEARRPNCPSTSKDRCPGEKHLFTFSPQQLLRRHPASAQAASIPGHCRLRHPRHDAGQEIQRPRGWLHRRRSHRRRPQRSAARPAPARSRRRAGLWPARRARAAKRSALWDCPSGWPAPMAAPANSPRPCAWARPACRWGPPLPSAKSPASSPNSNRQALRLSRLGQARVFTDPLASPAGFPFKVAQIAQTLSDAALYESRPRICDLGYLRHPYRKTDGTIGYRCPAEPLANFLRKGGTLARIRAAANASATACPPPSASARSGPNPEPSCRSSPPATTWFTSPNSSPPAATPTPPPMSSANSWLEFGAFELTLWQRAQGPMAARGCPV